jgi:molecular chaperone IbpA
MMAGHDTDIASKEDIMRAIDFSPLFRSSVGFDRMSRMVDAAMQQAERVDNYPPYNIEKASDDAYRITLAVAGFSQDDIEITAQENQLVVKASHNVEAEQEKTYLHRGIAGRAFERSFQLADHIRVVSAEMENGLLHISLEREIPEELKPRKIEVKTTGGQKWLGKAA